jgi:predicted transcriptional regulator
MRSALDVEGLRRELVRRGMTAAELALIANLSEATISHCMTGRKVSFTTIRKMARALTLTPCLPGIDSIILEKQAADSAATTKTPGHLPDVFIAEGSTSAPATV